MGVEEDPQPDGAELVVWIAQNAERLQNEMGVATSRRVESAQR